MGIFSSILSSLTGKISGQENGSAGTQMESMGQNLMNQAARRLGEKLDESVNSAKINAENGLKRLKSVNENNYPEFQKNPEEYLRKEGILWFVRKELEAARYYYSGGKEGYAVSERVQSNRAALATPPFLLLKSEIEKTEIRVREMEGAKGYEFVRCENNNIIFRAIKTGRELSADESNEI